MGTDINLYKQSGRDDGTSVNFNVPRSLTYGLNAMANDDSGISESDNCTYNTLNGFSTLLKSASLVVTPSSYKEGKLYSVIPSDGSGDMSVVRATTATRVNSAGLVELVPYNLCDYSEDQTQWTSQDETTVTANSTTAPNGTLTADTVTPTAVNTDHYRGIVLSSQVGELTAFIYVKPNGYNFFDWGIWNGSQYLVRATFDLVNLTYTFTNAGTATIESVGNGWLKCGISGSNASLSTIALYYRVRPTGGTGGFTGNGTSGAFIWGAQLNIGSTALPYQKTETRLNIPRLDYSNGTCPSLLLEPQRTNLLTYSSSFDNSDWVKSNATISANTIASPSAIQDADSIIENTATGIHIFYQGPIAASSGIYTTSMFFKKNTRQYAFLQIAVNGAADRFTAVIDLNNGNVTDTTTVGSPTSTSYTTEDFGNGWYRLTVSAQHNSGNVFLVSGLSDSATPTYNVTGEPNYTGNGTGSVYAWGAQIEAGNYSTSFIPTTSASVTRNADVISKTGISSLIGQTEGSVFLDLYATGQNSDSNPGFSLLASVGNTNRVEIYTNNGVLGFIIYSPSATVVLSTYTIVPNERIRVALAYQSGATSLFVNGAQVASSAVTFSLSGLNDFILNKSLIGDLQAENSYNAAALWKTRLTNDELASLTTL
jgi:hypothetical protein